MRTTLLKKMSAVVMATLMVVAMFAGMAFSTSAVADGELEVTVGANATTTVAAVVDNGVVKVYLNGYDTDNTKVWAKDGVSVSIETASGEAIWLKSGTTKAGTYLGQDVVYDATETMPAWMGAVEALNNGADWVKFYGYDFTLTDGTTTQKWSDGKATWDPATGILNFADFVPAANVTLTVTGPKVVDGVSTGRKTTSYGTNGFRASIAYEKMEDLAYTDWLNVKTLKEKVTVPTAATTDVALGVNTTGLTFGDKADWLSSKGMVLSAVYVDNGIIFVEVDMKNNLIDETPIKFTLEDAAIATKDNKATFTATDYNETFTVALDDGTYGLVRFSATTNFDTDDVIANDDIVDLVKSSAFRSLKGLTSVQDGVIYVDMINGVVGQGSMVEFDKDGNFKGFKVKTGTTKYTQADVNKKLALFGYYTEADGSITSKIQNYWGSFTFYQPNDVPGFQDKFTGVKDLYTGSATVLVYNNGTEDVQAILYHNDAATVLPIVMGDVTYNVPVFHILRSDYTKAFAVGTASTQQVATTVTNAGTFSYSLTGSEMGIKSLAKTETPIAITLTSRVDLSQAVNADLTPNDAEVILVLRAPKNTKFEAVKTGTTSITEINAAAATALTTTDGLVDYYFALSYKSFADTTVGLKITYDNGVWKTMNIKTTWLIDAKSDAFKAFTNTIPATTTEFVIALPERPVESQETPSIETPVSSSTATPVESTPASSSTGSDLEVPGTGNPFSAVAYLITLCASAIGGISTLVIRKKK